MSSPATAIVVRVEESPVALALNDRSQALLELLPDAAAVTRFKRVVLQALSKNPDLLLCTSDSVVSSVFEAAAMGLEPTGAAGGAHLVPFNVNVGTQQSPRWEKRAQLIPDYRGVVRMLTRPRADGTPSDVLSVEARVVKEGDEFSYTLGTAATLVHVPALAANRSSKPTTHVYVIFRLRSGGTVTDVEDRAGIERIRQRGKKKGISPWDTDWDEMGKKTIVKRGAKLVPVDPAVRSILAREDELEEETVAPADAPVRTSAPRTAQLAARLRPAQAPEAVPPEPPAEDTTDAIFAVVDDVAAAAVPETLVPTLRDLAEKSGLAGTPTDPQKARLKEGFAGLADEVIQGGIRAAFGHDRLASAGEANAVITIADSLGDPEFRTTWAALAAAS